MAKIFQSKHFQDSDVKRNFFLNVFDGAVFSFAMSFVSLQTVFPVLVKKVSGSDFAIGLVPVIWAAGFNFPQIFIANHVRKSAYKKPFLLKTALGQRIPWLFLALFIFFFLEDMSAGNSLLILLLGLGLAAVGGSLNLPGWFDLISKITPVQLRGRMFAYRSVLGSLLGVAGGAVVIFILDNVAYPHNFGYLFLITFLVMMISYIFLIFLKEDKPNPSPQTLNYSAFFKKLVSILKSEANFRNFLIADSLMMLANMSHAFFAVFAIEKFGLADSYAGTFTIVMMVSMIIGSIYFGYVADRFGHKINLIWASLFTGIASVTALLSGNIYLYYIVFAGSALNITLLMVSRLTIIAELCSEDDRPTYVALTNLITAPFVLSGIFGGIIVQFMGYNTLFYLSALFAAASLLWMMLKVTEPRNITRQT